MCKHRGREGKIELCLTFLVMCFSAIIAFSRSVVMFVFDASCLSCVLACNIAVIDVIKTTIRSVIDRRDLTDSWDMFVYQCHVHFDDSCLSLHSC